MTLAKRNSGLFPALPTFFDDFFSRDLFNFPANLMTTFSEPAVNVKETEDRFEMEVAAPGLDKNDFKVELKDNMLTISSEKEEKNEEKDKAGNYTRREFRYQSFKRSFTLPENLVDGEKIEAHYENGILHILIPKMEVAKPKPVRVIEIA